ncbi:MAG: transcription termination factor NusA [candidate division KSB1 bacterium]|nr:transcription termination factor NusA [candidate division KSB1 bacterium]
MKSEISEAFLSLVKEKGMDKETLTQIIEEIFLAMIKKKYGTTDNFNVFVNLEKGEIEISVIKTVVEKVEDELTQVDLATAQAQEASYELGDEYLEFIPIESFGRRLILSAKQNLNQKLKDVEKVHIYEEFKNRVGEIIQADIRQINRDEIFLVADGTELIMPKREQIPNERYRRADTVRALIKEVRETPRLPEIIVSRADPMFIVRLFEREVPEIADGIIEIKGIAREPGERTKIAVYSHDKRIDAVGACVGMKGMRIQEIVKEINNEKIDIINWSAEPEIFITRALSPAKPKRIAIDEEARRVIAVLDDDQISLAIGKGGVNRRLAARLTGYDIQTVKEEEYRQLMAAEGAGKPLTETEGLTEKLINTLHLAGYETVESVLEAGVEKLMELPGIGQKKAEKIIQILESQKA